MSFWKGYWITLRPYLFFVSGASGLLGLSIAGRMSPVSFAAALFAFLLSYGLGQAVTDVFQTDTDALSAPYRPLVTGAIARGPVLAVSLSGLALCASAFFLLNPWTLVFAAAAVFGLLTYTPAKRRFWAGPAWNSWIVALLPVLGFLCGGRPVNEALADVRLGLAAASVFFTYAIFVLIGYLKDVEADRQTGYDTVPVRFGRRAAVWVSFATLLAGGAASAAFVALTRGAVTPGGALGLAGWAAGLLLLGRAHVLALKTTRDDEAHPAIALAVRGYVLLHLGESAVARPDLGLLAVVLYATFEGVLARRPSVTQI